MAEESRYNWGQFNHEELSKKTHPVGYFAYAIAYNRDMVKFPGQALHSSIILDCDGAPVPRTVSKEVGNAFAQLCPGAEWANPDWTSRYGWGLHKSPGIIIDLRKWWMILLGCCPKFEEYY